jgi:hypothetical protein
VLVSRFIKQQFQHGAFSFDLICMENRHVNKSIGSRICTDVRDFNVCQTMYIPSLTVSGDYRLIKNISDSINKL